MADCFPVLIADRAGGRHRRGARGLAWLRPADRGARRSRRSGRASGPGRRNYWPPSARASAAAVSKWALRCRPDSRNSIPGCRCKGRTLRTRPARFSTCRARSGCSSPRPGVRAATSSTPGLCTKCNAAEFFSYRGEGPRSGRLMAVIARHKGISSQRRTSQAPGSVRRLWSAASSAPRIAPPHGLVRTGRCSGRLGGGCSHRPAAARGRPACRRPPRRRPRAGRRM